MNAIHVIAGIGERLEPDSRVEEKADADFVAQTKLLFEQLGELESLPDILHMAQIGVRLCAHPPKTAASHAEDVGYLFSRIVAEATA